MIQSLNENEIIAHMGKSFPIKGKDFIGIGDDAAVLKIDSDQSLLLTKDLIIEDVHFRLDYYSPEELAHKALHVNFSDLAAKGAKPQYVILGLAATNKINMTWIERFSTEFAKVCSAYDVLLIGGDTTASRSGLFISITACAIINSSQIKFRSGAKLGDIICVTGTLGEAHAGLIALERGINHLYLEEFIKKQKMPLARINEGIWLANIPSVNCMMDLSDGLAIDLERLCKASSVGAKIELCQLPLSDTFKLATSILNLDPINCAVEGGEDYELLFTIDKMFLNQVQNQYLSKFNSHIFPIGKITDDLKISFFNDGKRVTTYYNPYTHFGENNEK